jgi:hypothetical protein
MGYDKRRSVYKWRRREQPQTVQAAVEVRQRQPLADAVPTGEN